MSGRRALQERPEVIKRLYARFGYLRGQPLRLWSLPGTTYLGVLDLPGRPLFVLVDHGDALPYRPRFTFLTDEENDRLTGCVQLHPVLPPPSNEGVGP